VQLRTSSASASEAVIARARVTTGVQENSLRFPRCSVEFLLFYSVLPLIEIGRKNLDLQLNVLLCKIREALPRIFPTLIIVIALLSYKKKS
jgi:hypothetical protein